METMIRDPHYIAQTLKLLRKMLHLTQENLADAANLSTRTIEKIESGRHTPNEQTLRSLARALNVDMSVFDRPAPEEKQRLWANLKRSVRKTAFAPTRAVQNASDFLMRFGQPNALRFDMSAVEGDEPMEFAANMGDYLEDMILAWGDDMSQSLRVSAAREVADMCSEIEQHGYLCHLGHHRQRLREKGKSDRVWNVAVFVLLPKEHAEGERYAMVTLEGAWEVLEEDRLTLPAGR